MILACKDINKAYGINTILDKITFHLEEKEKAAIVGVNGAGKTTLFKIITNQVSKDNGELFLRKDAAIGYLEQNISLESNRTIYTEMLDVFAPIFALEKQIRQMETNMADVEKKDLPSYMDQYAKLQHEFEQKDGYQCKSKVIGVLKGLGFGEEEFNQPMNQLSGGQKTRVHLGKLLLTQPDLLLLDEPTNHLDIDSIQWLEDFLRSYSGAVLIISHDRYFMDRIVTKIIEIENKKSNVYEGNYSFYMTQKQINREIQEKQYTQQQKEIQRQEDVIRTLRSFNREKSIKRAESRQKALEKMDKLERPESAPEKMRFHLEPQISSGNDVLSAQELSKSFDGNQLFQSVTFDVKRGEKIAIIGPNGIGKSTLFKMLLGQVPLDKGSIQFGIHVNLGYYDQEQQQLDESNTIFQEISDTYPTLTNGEIRNILAAFVFTGDDIYKPISALSGGERGRVSLAKIMLSKANLLMLDEPTNHLDMFSKEILENAINHYTGTVIYISHDRYFINRTAQKILELTPNGVKQYLGDYTYYLEKKNENARLSQLFSSDETKVISSTEAPGKTDWKKQKEEQAKQRKLINQIERLEKQINATEEKISELETLLFQEEVSTNPIRAKEIFDEKTQLETQLEQFYEQWELLQD